MNKRNSYAFSENFTTYHQSSTTKEQAWPAKKTAILKVSEYTETGALYGLLPIIIKSKNKTQRSKSIKYNCNGGHVVNKILYHPKLDWNIHYRNSRALGPAQVPESGRLHSQHATHLSTFGRHWPLFGHTCYHAIFFSCTHQDAYPVAVQTQPKSS